MAYAAGAFTLLFVIFANPLIDLAAAGRAVALLRLGGRTSGPPFRADRFHQYRGPPAGGAGRARAALAVWPTSRRRAAAAWAGPGCRSPEISMPRSCFPYPPGRQVAAQVSFVAALAVHETVGRLRPDLAVRIKWPNDVLIGGAKFCGVLSEVVGTAPTRIAFGCGINVAHAPKGTPYPVTALGLRCTVESVLQELDSSLSNCLKIWDEGRGFEAIRAAWTAAALGIGGQVTASIAGRSDIRHLRRPRAGWCAAAADRRRNSCGRSIPVRSVSPHSKS